MLLRVNVPEATPMKYPHGGFPSSHHQERVAGGRWGANGWLPRDGGAAEQVLSIHRFVARQPPDGSGGGASRAHPHREGMEGDVCYVARRRSSMSDQPHRQGASGS